MHPASELTGGEPTAEVFGGFDMSYQAPEPERHSQQADYLRIIQDKFGAPKAQSQPPVLRYRRS
jgi:hypothetical protein